MNMYKAIRKQLRPIKKFVREKKLFYHIKNEVKLFRQKISISNPNDKRVFYLGITEHANLGDLAQFYCIKKWINQNFSDYNIFYCESTTVIDTCFDWLKYFKKTFNAEKDIIIFQSGYTTQDLGGNHELMHRLIADNLPDAKILMMPQTIYFQNESNRQRTSQSYDKCSRMLFLARDEVSYKDALKMFPHLKVYLYPDIVTSLIGNFFYENKRDKIFLCRRNDGEKYYSENELNDLKSKLKLIAPVDIGDTQSPANAYKTRKNLEYYLTQQIEKLSHYKVVITDRYHGTIFSLCANTPVIIIKTNDHKVVTGANWFKGIYDDQVFVADSLEEAYIKAVEICNNYQYHKLKPYFEEKYYDKLFELFQSV